jgi:hypothetical protein
MISVDCVHPIGRRASDAASSHIASRRLEKSEAGGNHRRAKLLKDICNVIPAVRPVSGT